MGVRGKVTDTKQIRGQITCNLILIQYSGFFEEYGKVR
jgi:hypothetical protein